MNPIINSFIYRMTCYHCCQVAFIMSHGLKKILPFQEILQPIKWPKLQKGDLNCLNSRKRVKTDQTFCYNSTFHTYSSSVVISLIRDDWLLFRPSILFQRPVFLGLDWPRVRAGTWQTVYVIPAVRSREYPPVGLPTLVPLPHSRA